MTLRPTPSGIGDVQVSTVDGHGRIWLRRPAFRLGWTPGARLEIAVRDGGLVSLRDAGGGNVGVTVELDPRYRVLVPFGLRAAAGLFPRARALVVTAHADASVAVIPVDRVLGALLAAP